MSILKLLVTIVLALSLGNAVAGEDKAKQVKFSITASQSETATVIVEAVDYESREVTVREPDGKISSFVAPEEVRNLAQVKAGDEIIAEYTVNMTIDVIDEQASVPTESEFFAVGTAEEGLKPGITQFDSYVVTAKVEEIDLEANTLKLRWPDGMLEEYTARDPGKLEMAVVGDLVVITRTETVSISVEDTGGE